MSNDFRDKVVLVTGAGSGIGRKALRKEGDRTPLFFYAASNAPEHKRETREHGGQGCTHNAQELFEMVTRSVMTAANNRLQRTALRAAAEPER